MKSWKKSLMLLTYVGLLVSCDFTNAQFILPEERLLRGFDKQGDTFLVVEDEDVYCFANEKLIFEKSLDGHLFGVFLETTLESKTNLVLCESAGKGDYVVNWIDLHNSKIRKSLRFNFKDSAFDRMTDFQKTSVPGVYFFFTDEGSVAIWNSKTNEYWFLAWETGRQLRSSYSKGQPKNSHHLSNQFAEGVGESWGIVEFEFFERGAIAVVCGDTPSTYILEVFQFKQPQGSNAKIAFEKTSYSTSLTYKIGVDTYKPLAVAMNEDGSQVVATSKSQYSRAEKIHVRRLDVLTGKWTPETSTIELDSNERLHDLMHKNDNLHIVSTIENQAGLTEKFLIREFPSEDVLTYVDDGRIIWPFFSEHGPVLVQNKRGVKEIVLIEQFFRKETKVGKVKSK